MPGSAGGALAVLLVQTAAAWFMAGLIWTMQILNYPLLAKVDPADVPQYEQAHNRRFIWLVGPGVAVTFASASSRVRPRCKNFDTVVARSKTGPFRL